MSEQKESPKIVLPELRDLPLPEDRAVRLMQEYAYTMGLVVRRCRIDWNVAPRLSPDSELVQKWVQKEAAVEEHSDAYLTLIGFLEQQRWLGRIGLMGEVKKLPTVISRDVQEEMRNEWLLLNSRLNGLTADPKNTDFRGYPFPKCGLGLYQELKEKVHVLNMLMSQADIFDMVFNHRESGFQHFPRYGNRKLEN